MVETNLRNKLLSVSRQVKRDDRLSPAEIKYLLDFKYVEKENKLHSIIQSYAFPFAILLGAIMAMYSGFFDAVFARFPRWTFLTTEFQTGFDYVWSIIGSPVEKANFFYHVPNIIMYGIGLISIKGIIDAIHKRDWLDIVTSAQVLLKEKIETGTLNYDLKKGHSILFVGKGDFIAQQFTEDHNPNEVITLAEIRQLYTDIWQQYKTESHEENLNVALKSAEASRAGEYIFFPVQDIHIFLPSSTAFDMPPHRIDLHCQYIRRMEERNKWERNPIFIVGDKFHKSVVQTEDKTKILEGSEDIISLESIAKRYPEVKIIDPTDIVLNHILKMAKDRKIVFRATVDGINEYKGRFYKRLEKMGYGKNPKEKGVFIVGYDIYEDQIEQQKLCGKLDDYYPVVLSKNVHDALISNGHKESELIYVPDLVIKELKRLAKQQ